MPSNVAIGLWFGGSPLRSEFRVPPRLETGGSGSPLRSLFRVPSMKDATSAESERVFAVRISLWGPSSAFPVDSQPTRRPDPTRPCKPRGLLGKNRSVFGPAGDCGSGAVYRDSWLGGCGSLSDSLFEPPMLAGRTETPPAKPRRSSFSRQLYSPLIRAVGRRLALRLPPRTVAQLRTTTTPLRPRRKVRLSLNGPVHGIALMWEVAQLNAVRSDSDRLP